MVDKNKLSKDFEDQIQSLAGDIYIQVEEKVSALLSTLTSTVNEELSLEQIEQQTHYKTLKKFQAQTQAEFDKTRQDAEKRLLELEQYNAKLNEQVSQNQQELKNIAQLSNAKLSDTDVVLKEKINEVDELTKQVERFVTQEQQIKEKLADSEQKIKELIELKTKFDQVEANLMKADKADKAKVVALDIQSHQIEELQLQVNNANGELEQLQLERSKTVESNTKELLKEQKLTVELNEKIDELTKQIQQVNEIQKSTVKSGEEQLNKTQLLTKENNDLMSLIAEHKEKQKADFKSMELQKVEAQTLKNELNDLDIKFKQEQKNSEDKTAQLTTLKQEHGKQDKQQQTATDKISILELANQQLQKQHEQFLQEQKKSTDNLHIIAKEYQDKIAQLTERLTSSEQKIAHDNKTLLQSESVLELEKKQSTEKLADLQQKYDSITTELESERTTLSNHMENMIVLEKKLQQSQSEQGDVQQRIDLAKLKFENDNNQARETIKYLRDENHDITTKSQQRITELEDKLTEYRLRFEYAQKQLQKDD